jgi:hypothetical protein
MTPSTIVTEGEHDRLLLLTLLNIDPDDTRIRILAAGSWSSADSLARSLLVHGKERVAIVVDADTTDPILVEDRKRFLRGSLGSIAPSTQWRAYVIEPQIEGLIFHDRHVVEGLVGHAITDTDFVRGRFEPKKTLSDLLHRRSLRKVYETELSHLNLETLRSLPEITELRSFVQGADASHIQERTNSRAG